MSLPLWGGLEKAQDDAQTIEEAIDAAILAHENDPTAHLGTGESLEAHKTEDVIDHPAFSVLDDKFAYDRRTFNFNMADYALYDKGAEVSLAGYNTLLLIGLSSGATMWFGVNPSDFSDTDWFEYQKNPRFIITLMVAAITNQTAYALVSDPNNLRGFGFKIVNATLSFRYTDSSNAEQLTTIATLSAGVPVKLDARVFYGDRIDVYLNNVLTVTITSPDLPTSLGSIPYHVWLKINTVNSVSREFYASDIYWEADI